MVEGGDTYLLVLNRYDQATSRLEIEWTRSSQER